MLILKKGNLEDYLLGMKDILLDRMMKKLDKIFLVLVTIVITTIFVLGAIDFFTTYKTYKLEVQQTLEEIESSVAEEVDAGEQKAALNPWLNKENKDSE